MAALTVALQYAWGSMEEWEKGMTNQASPARHTVAQSSYTAQNPDAVGPRLGAKPSGTQRPAKQHPSIVGRAKIHGIV